MSPLTGIGALWLGAEALKAGAAVVEAFNPARLFGGDENAPAATASAAAGPLTLRDRHRLEEELDAALARLHARIKDLAAAAETPLPTDTSLAVDPLGRVSVPGEQAAGLNALLAADPEAQALAGYLTAALHELRAARGEAPADGPVSLRWSPYELTVAESP